MDVDLQGNVQKYDSEERGASYNISGIISERSGIESIKPCCWWPSVLSCRIMASNGRRQESTHRVCVKLGTIDIASTPKATPTETLAFGLAQRLQYIVCVRTIEDTEGRVTHKEVPLMRCVGDVVGFEYKCPLCRRDVTAKRAGTQSAASSSYGREWIFEFKEAYRRFASDKATTTTGVTGDLDNGTATTSATPIAEATASTSAMESR
ncbi:hypothetical protein EDB85DRAFT_2277197 [Lactarius pseudohatsudake]|nr:hypothetical protein EDB85DRAFT_2277197 [Lactarius pseudohatsudake]